jgi:hypothetical protein
MPLLENNDTNSEIAALKNQVFVLLVALVVVTGTLTVYLYRQASIANKDFDQNYKAFTQTQASINTFVERIVAYGEKHPDFVPVLKKYGIAPVPGIPANAPAGATPKK